MTPTQEQRSDALGLAHGFAADHDPTVAPKNPREALAGILDVPVAEVPTTCVLAYFGGVQDGRDYRANLDRLGAA